MARARRGNPTGRHFSALPVFKKMSSMDLGYMIRQLKSWFSLFGVARIVRSDKGPPFSSRAFKFFYDEYRSILHLCAPYNPDSLGAAEGSSFK